MFSVAYLFELQMIEAESKEIDAIEEDGLELDLVSQMADMSLRATSDVKQEADDSVKENVLTMDNPIFQKRKRSSKVSI